MSDVLRVDQVGVRFGGVAAVDGVSLRVADGDLLGFIGPNGAGKTTLMRVITGMVKPDHGSVWLNGVDITRWSIERRVRAGLALAQQIVQPFNALTVCDNVALAVGGHYTRHPLTALRHTARSAERREANALLHRVGIGEAADALPPTLPLGMLKRLEVARALALKPGLLLLDEPLAGLNQGEAGAMADLIKSLADSGQTTILIEHNLKEVVRVCSRLYVQDQGKPLALGSVTEVVSDPAVRRAYLGGQH